MSVIKKHKNLLIIAISLITTWCISITNVNNDFIFDGNNFKWIIVLGLIYLLIKNALVKTNKRLLICSGIFGLIISVFAILGYTADNFFNNNIDISKKDLFVILCKLEACFVTITGITMIIMRKLPEIIEKMKNKKEYKFFTANKKSILVVTIILFVTYLPYLLYYYPGNVLIDSTIQIMQGMGDLKLTNHHPAIHTGIITLCLKFGHLLTNNYNFGVFLYTFLQTIATCLIFSFTIYYMARKKVPTTIRTISLLFYALCPTIAFFTMTMYKDIPFALFMLLLTICMVEIMTNRENFVKSKLRLIFTAIIVFGACIFRNNGLYAVILTFLVLLVILKKYKLKVCLVFFTGIVACLIVTGPVYKILGIEQGSPKEALSVVFQQFARLSKYEVNNLTEEEKEIIYRYIPVENLGELYNPVFADPVKSNVSEEEISKDKVTVIKMYLSLALKYPKHTIASLICGSYGYYYPNTLGWGVYTGINEEGFIGEAKNYGIKEQPLVQITFLDKINNFVNTRDIPVVSMFLNIGFLFWIFIFGIIYCIYRKNYKLILIYLPVLCMWLTTLLSPVFGEARYVYSLFTCLPLLLAITFNKEKGEKNA